MDVFHRLVASLNRQGQTLGELSKKVSTSSKKEPSPIADIQITPEYLEIKRLIDEKHKLIFVTGGAGTGKSTFVKWIEKEYSGKVAIAAPTGIAALTVSGMTIHKLCKFPPAWIVDSDIKVDPKSVIPRIEILIIDEISMVNSNLLDSIDKFCKLQRKSKKPFGGLTIIMVGDLFQLPPVVTSSTEPLFRREYESAKFFAANCVREMSPAGVELTSPFRQKDETLVRLLANLREGIDLQETIGEFNSLCEITNHPPVGAVHLAPRNRDVELINSAELNKLPTPEFTFESRLAGRFSEKQLPAPETVVLRKGAQVVMLCNSKEWVNGNVGVIIQASSQSAIVKLIESGKSVEVKPYVWRNYEYNYNEKEKKVERQEVGTFTQIPVSLAWAMTIHKSQGLTLDKVHLNLSGGAFETGQTYVALSRCREITAISLARKLSENDVLVDLEAVNFYRAIRG